MLRFDWVAPLSHALLFSSGLLLFLQLFSLVLLDWFASCSRSLLLSRPIGLFCGFALASRTLCQTVTLGRTFNCLFSVHGFAPPFSSSPFDEGSVSFERCACFRLSNFWSLSTLLCFLKFSSLSIRLASFRRFAPVSQVLLVLLPGGWDSRGLNALQPGYSN